jgi:hypothetical protein
VDAVLAVYPPEQVVLVRGHLSRFFWDGERVAPRTRLGDRGEATRLRQVLRQLDDRFAQRVGCHVVDLARGFLPHDDLPGEDFALGADFTLALETTLARISRSGVAPEVAPAVPEPDDTFAAAIHHDLLAGAIDPAGVPAASLPDGLRTFDDAAALAAAVAAAPDADWTAVAAHASAGTGRPAEAMRDLFVANRATLAAHPHTYIDTSGLEPDGRLVVRLAGHWFLTVRDGSIAVHPYGRRPEFDAQAFINGGSVCGPAEIDNALESWAAYFERGRRGDTTPFQLTFPSRDAFADSLYHLDYADILANENYCLTLEGRLPSVIEWEPRVDARFLFDPRSRVCLLRNGLGDQLFHYVHTRNVADRHGLRLYADDLYFDDTKARLRHLHSRPDIVSIATFDGVFSDLFSRRLRLVRRSRRQILLDRSEYVALGLREQVLAVDRLKMAAFLDRGIDPAALTICVLSLEHLDRVMAEPPGGVLFVDVLAKGKWLNYSLMRQKRVWEHTFHRGELVSPASAEIAERMLATDAIVVHVRRGDRVARGTTKADDYYRDFIERTSTLDKYADKHWFVFSDDLAYCREHRAELGLDLAGEAITFVEGNHHFATLDDFHLMMLGKVVICGESGFSATAALISTRVDHIFGTGYPLKKGGDAWHRPARRHRPPSKEDSPAPPPPSLAAFEHGPSTAPGRLRRALGRLTR